MESQLQQKRKIQMIHQTGEACNSMINNIRQLRLSVLDLFTTLADNGPDSTRNNELQQENLLLNGGNGNKLYHQQILSNLQTSHQLCTSSLPSYKIQKQQEQQQHADLIQYVNKMISSISTTIRSLDQDISSIMQLHPYPITTGELVHIGMDCTVEKHNLYKELCKSFKTSTKLHEYAATCHSLLSQQSLKRVHRKFDLPNIVVQSGGREPKAESVVATFNPYIPRPMRGTIISILENCMKVCDVVKGTYSQPFGSSTGVFQLSVNRMLKAIVMMRGIMIDVVIVKAHHESFALKATSKPGSSNSLLAGEYACDKLFVDADDDIDLWSESKYAVFRKLTQQANAAVLHFQYPTYPEIAVRSFLSWFTSYADLFTATCSRCNTKLRKFMPPICRDFSSGFLPHHDSCK